MGQTIDTVIETTGLEIITGEKQAGKTTRVGIKQLGQSTRVIAKETGRTTRVVAKEAGRTTRTIAKETGQTTRVTMREFGRSERFTAKIAGEVAERPFDDAMKTILGLGIPLILGTTLVMYEYIQVSPQITQTIAKSAENIIETMADAEVEGQGKVMDLLEKRPELADKAVEIVEAILPEKQIANVAENITEKI